jgi:hypothetical protein
VSIKINRVPLHVANNPVGLKSRIIEVASLLEFESDEIESQYYERKNEQKNILIIAE